MSTVLPCLRQWLIDSILSGGVSSRNPHLSQPCHQVFLRPVPLDPVTVGTEQLQVLDVVLSAGILRDDVVNLKVAELEGRPAAVAVTLLLPEQEVLVLTVRDQCLDVRSPRNVSSGCL